MRGRLISAEERATAIELINEAHAAGARKRKACEILNLSLRTLERWEKAGGTEDKRHCAIREKQPNQLTEAEREVILATLNSEEYRDLPPSKIVPQLADKGLYLASESTFYRILREEKQLTHRQSCKAKKNQSPKACMATGPNQVWSWDISYLPSQIRGAYFYLYLVMDVYSRKIVGWSIYDMQTADYGASLVKQTCLDEGVKQDQVTLHSDNGKPMKGMTMLAMLESLGVMPSFSRPSVSDDNPYSESLFRTVKYHPTYPKQTRFETIEDARKWMLDFTQWYNYQHQHSGLKFVTPDQRHTGNDKDILDKRHHVYQLAKLQNPERWSGETRNWKLPSTVTLNPDKKGRIAAHNIPAVLMAA